CHRVCDMRQSSALDSALQVSQTFDILVVVEVRTEHSLDDRTTFRNWNCFVFPCVLVWRILETLVDEFMIRFRVNVSLDSGFPLNDVFFTVTDSAMTASRFHELSTAYTIAMNRAVKLQAKNSKLLAKIKNDDHDSMVKAFSKRELLTSVYN
nr:hypothetical protein [Tanacetum cinerariifolium]